MWWLPDNRRCLVVPQVRVKTNTCLGGQVQQKAFVETLIQMPQSHPSQGPRGARSPFQHMLLGRCCLATERTFRVVDVSTILGPAMVTQWSVPVRIFQRTIASVNFVQRTKFHNLVALHPIQWPFSSINAFLRTNRGNFFLTPVLLDRLFTNFWTPQ